MQGKQKNHDQIFDFISSLLERSPPDVLKNKLQFKKPLKCLEYGAKTYSSYFKCEPLNEFDSLVESLLIQ